MGLQIIKTPGLVGLSKNIIAYQVSSSDGLDVIGVLEVETFYGSNVYEPVVQLRSKPQNNICTFYLQDILENDVLNYTQPSSSPLYHDDNVCKRMRMTFYEVKVDLVVFFQGNPVSGLLSFSALTVDQDYWFVVKPASTTSIVVFGASSKTVPLYYSPSADESWYNVFANAPFNTISGAGTELIIYEGRAPGRAISDVLPGIIAGRSFENIRV